jgi:rubrerythrin
MAKKIVRRKEKEEEFSPVKTVPSKLDATLPLYRCQFCNHEWIPRQNVPAECPNCKRRGWYSPTAKYAESEDGDF